MLSQLALLARDSLRLRLSSSGLYNRIGDRPFDWAAHPIRGLAGDPLPAKLFEGKVVLLANSASRCGFTRHYAGLQELWRSYQDRGLVVLAIPTNDFGGQEPGANAEIDSFCRTHFSVSFPIAGKSHALGAEVHPLFSWIDRVSDGRAGPKWNFYKYLIDRDGRLDAWFSSTTAPAAAHIQRRIDALLVQPSQRR